jgi:hypothetical protein
MDKVIMLYTGRMIFWQYIPKEYKDLASTFTNCVTLWATLMSVHLGKQWQHSTITATHVTVLQVIPRVKGVGHKVFMDNYFTSPALFDDLFQCKINAHGTVRHDRRGMPRHTGPNC